MKTRRSIGRSLGVWVLASATTVATGTSIAGCGDDYAPLVGGSDGGEQPPPSTGETCDAESDLWMDYCSEGCGPVMSCVAKCPSCDSLCQVACNDNADCAKVGAGSCIEPESEFGTPVCSQAPTRCGPESETPGGGGSCVADDGACVEHEDCCNYGEGTGDCITQPNGNGKCVNFCTSSSECSTGCCRELQGGGSACAPAEYC